MAKKGLTRWLLVPAFLAVSLTVYMYLQTSLSTPRHNTVFIEMRVNQTDPFAVKGFFSPNYVEISVGDEVVWVNKDFRPHSVESPDGLFNSGWLKEGEKWSYRFEKEGVYRYRCMICFCNPMEGTIVVKKQGS